MDASQAASLSSLSALLFASTAFMIGGLVVYIYMALALMTIAKKTNTPNGWLAWIPIANIYLMTQIAQVPAWTMLIIFVGFVPVIGSLAVLAVMLWWWWKIAERRNQPGWLGILLIVPVVDLIIPGLLAWYDKPIAASTVQK